MSIDQFRLKTALSAITEAKNIIELEMRFGNLFEILDSVLRPHLVLWSDLRDITNTVERCIEKIEVLPNLDQGNNAERIGNLFGTLAQRLERFGLHVTAVGILSKLWNQLGMYQSRLDGGRQHVYRAGICYYLGQICYMKGDLGQAIWWLLHAQADDTLPFNDDMSEFPVGGACDFLRLNFGIGDEVFRYLAKCERHVQGEPHTMFAEHLIMQLSLESSFAHLFSHPTLVTEFPIGCAYAGSMLARIAKKNAKGEYEGDTLEEFARYLVLLLAGWVPTRNLYHYRTAIDSDVVARFIREPESISSSHSRAILVECKNRERPLNVAEAGYFLYRMSLTQVEVGILFVRKVTGDKQSVTQDENAKHLLDLAFHQSGRVVIVIDLDDLKEVANGQKTIWTLIDSGIVNRRFGASKGS